MSELGRLGFRGGDVIRLEDLDLAALTCGAARPARVDGPPLAAAAGMSREAWEQVREVVDSAAAAAGGLEALRAVKTLRARRGR